MYIMHKSTKNPINPENTNIAYILYTLFFAETYNSKLLGIFFEKYSHFSYNLGSFVQNNLFIFPENDSQSADLL